MRYSNAGSPVVGKAVKGDQKGPSDSYEDNDFEETVPLKNQKVNLGPHSNITPKALKSGNSDQNADSDEFQEINDNDLQAYEREFEPVRKDKKKKSNQPL